MDRHFDLDERFDIPPTDVDGDGEPLPDGDRDCFFDVYGPYPVVADKVAGDDEDDGEPALSIRREAQTLWDDVERDHPQLGGALGVYMLCLQQGGTMQPWYVGRADSLGGFRAEVFGDDKLALYDINRIFAGRRMLLLFPFMTGYPGEIGSPCRDKRAVRAIDGLEETMIQLALQRSPRLLNLKDPAMPTVVNVRGVLGEKFRGRSRLGADAVHARAALGLSPF